MYFMIVFSANTWSLPLWAAWIEILSQFRPNLLLWVAAFMGGVD